MPIIVYMYILIFNSYYDNLISMKIENNLSLLSCIGLFLVIQQSFNLHSDFRGCVAQASPSLKFCPLSSTVWIAKLKLQIKQ